MGSLLSGRVLDWDFQRIKRQLEDRRRQSDKPEDSVDFPIEKVSLCIAQAFHPSTYSSGLRLVSAFCPHLWCYLREAALGMDGVYKRKLISQFPWLSSSSVSYTITTYLSRAFSNTIESAGYTTMAILTTIQTVTVDLVPNQGSSVSACVCVSCIYLLTITDTAPIAEQPLPGINWSHNCRSD